MTVLKVKYEPPTFKNLNPTFLTALCVFFNWFRCMIFSLSDCIPSVSLRGESWTDTSILVRDPLPELLS